MVAAVALQGQTQPKSQQFFMATPEGLKQDYKAKILNAEAYLYYLIKAKNKAGWEWCFNVKRFCAEWEIAESTFYRALSKLRVKNLIFWRPADNTVVIQWGKEVTKIANIHSSDSANRSNPGTVIALSDVREPLLDVGEPLQDVREQNAKTLTVAQSCNPSYSLQIDPKINTDSKEEVCVVFEKVLDQDPEYGQESFANFENFENEINRDAIFGSPTTLLNKTQISGVVDITSDGGQAWAAPISDTKPIYDTETLGVANTTSSEGRGFAPPVRKTSQKQKWICPGTEEEKNEFLIFKGELLVAAKQCKPVEARAAALSWADHKPVAANLLWEDWQRQKAEDANRSTAIETVPEFRRMPEQEHAEVLQKFINHTKQEFLKLCWWHEYWLEFACRQFRLRQELIPGLTAEIIKEIKA